MSIQFSYTIESWIISSVNINNDNVIVKKKSYILSYIMYTYIFILILYILMY